MTSGAEAICEAVQRKDVAVVQGRPSADLPDQPLYTSKGIKV